MESSFDWKTQLNCKDFQAASVQDFPHVPFSGKWDKIVEGIKVEVKKRDAGRENRAAYWVASVIKIQGYYGLLRYEGFGDDHHHDFWIHLCSQDVQHIGWCAKNGKKLDPPQSILHKFRDFQDLKDFYVNCVTGASTIPENFHDEENDSESESLEVGRQWEVVDSYRICRLKLATARKVVGQRIYMQYFDSNNNEGFWFDKESRQIHPMGWAKTVGHQIVAPPSYNPRELSPSPSDQKFDYMSIKEGMTMEAINPLTPRKIGVATVKKVLRRGYVMVKVEGNKMKAWSKGNDWFCFHITSPELFPCGFCAENEIPLTKPKTWAAYPTAPVERKEIRHGLRVGMKVEVADPFQPNLITLATIVRVVGRLLKISFDGWGERFDQWMDARSPDIYPIGWCELVNHKLVGPPPPKEHLEPVKMKKKEKKKVSVRGRKMGAGRPPKVITSVPLPLVQAVKRSAPPTVTPEPVAKNARAVAVAPRRTSYRASPFSKRVWKSGQNIGKGWDFYKHQLFLAEEHPEGVDFKSLMGNNMVSSRSLSQRRQGSQKPTIRTNKVRK